VSYELIVLDEAEAELQEAIAWYQGQREGLGDEFQLEVGLTFAAIVRNPMMFGAIQAGIHRAPLHRFPYTVYYRVEGNKIRVYAVFHGSRDPKEWRRRV
jgi:plasmid stabilization system protein ParE